MKKYLSMILVLVMVFALAVPAFAVDIDNDVEGSASQDVTAGYTAPTDTAGKTVYRVTLAWEQTDTDEALSYTGKAHVYTWNTDTLVYEDTGDAAKGWSGSTGYKLTVTNYSNAEVDAETQATNTYSLTLTTDGDKTATLESAAKGIDFKDTVTEGEATTAEVTYTYSAVETASAPALDTAGNTVTVGTITVTVTGK